MMVEVHTHRPGVFSVGAADPFPSNILFLHLGYGAALLVNNVSSPV